MKPDSISKKFSKIGRKHFHVPMMLLTALVVSAIFAAVPQKAFSSETDECPDNPPAASSEAASTETDGTEFAGAEAAGAEAASNASTGTEADITEDTNSSAASSSEASETSETSPRTPLEEYAAGLDTLYGKSFKGLLWKADHKEHEETQGYDYSDLPVGNAASFIYDFDQDGQDELLTVSINEDYTLTLTMFETGEDNTVHSSASFLSVLDLDGKEYPVYAVEQGEGMTDVFLYENEGPKICIDSAGMRMNTSEGRHIIMALTYNGTAFAQYNDPFWDSCSGAYYGEHADNICKSLESFGAESVTIRELNEICMYLTPFMEYLPGVHEIYRADAEVTVENEVLEKWTSSESKDSIEVTSIYFKEKNELYDHEKVERFTKFLSGNTQKTLPFCEELLYHGTLYWRTTFAASGKDGNLYKAGYSHLDFDREALEKKFESRFPELELTFWVTKDKPWKEREEIYLVDNLTDEDKKALLEKGTLPDNAVLVCSKKDMPDSLEKGEAGVHQSIETNVFGYIEYHRYQVPFTNFEPRYLLTLFWKKGEGLIGYQSTRTPAGADCIQVWDPAFLERDSINLIQ